MHGELKILTGTANPELAEAIAQHLGRPLTPVLCETFSDGEIRVEIGDNVRGCDVYVIQPTCAPSNHNIMQLAIMLDALKRSSAMHVTAIIPYYGYARQDRKVNPRAPISAKLVADILQVAGMGRMVTMDLHAGQIQGFFNVPVDNLYASPVLLDYLYEVKKGIDCELVVVSPDAGGVERARAFAKRLDAGLAIIDKRRDKPNQAEAMNLIGDVAGKVAIVFDDMIDTAGTLVSAGNVILEHGAKDVMAAACHAVLSGPAIERLNNSPFSQVIVTDTIPLQEKVTACSKLKVLSVAPLLAKAIHNIHTGSSVSVLFV
jgi:ribose-phosphate pyrophosphokinase